MSVSKRKQCILKAEGWTLTLAYLYPAGPKPPYHGYLREPQRSCRMRLSQGAVWSHRETSHGEHDKVGTALIVHITTHGCRNRQNLPLQRAGGKAQDSGSASFLWNPALVNPLPESWQGKSSPHHQPGSGQSGQQGRCSFLPTSLWEWDLHLLCTKGCAVDVCARSLCRVWLFVTLWMNPPGFSAHGIFQASIWEWVAISYSGGILPGHQGRPLRGLTELSPDCL